MSRRRPRWPEPPDTPQPPEDHNEDEGPQRDPAHRGRDKFTGHGPHGPFGRGPFPPRPDPRKPHRWGLRHRWHFGPENIGPRPGEPGIDDENVEREWERGPGADMPFGRPGFPGGATYRNAWEWWSHHRPPEWTPEAEEHFKAFFANPNFWRGAWWNEGMPPWVEDPRAWREFAKAVRHLKHAQEREWRHRAWQQRGRGLFVRFALSFGLMAVLVIGGLGILGYTLTRFLGSSAQSAVLMGSIGCILSLALPILGAAIAVNASRGIVRPIGEVMAAADAVAEGNLGVSVPEGPGQFGKLAQSFNRMVEELARAEEQRRNLTADVAHELRTPLHILQGSIEGLIDGVYQPTPEHLNAMLDETHLLSRLIEDLRTLSLAESGHLPLHKENIMAADVVSDVATSFSGPAETAGIDLRAEVAMLEGAKIEADPARLNQVMSNLVANALRYTPEGGRITLTGQKVDHSVQLVVKDTGEGIAPDDLPYIFDRFWKGDKARSRDGAGSGLGLAIANQLIHLHGGHIEVESAIGEGTTFTVEIPAI